MAIILSRFQKQSLNSSFWMSISYLVELFLISSQRARVHFSFKGVFNLKKTRKSPWTGDEDCLGMADEVENSWTPNIVIRCFVLENTETQINALSWRNTFSQKSFNRYIRVLISVFRPTYSGRCFALRYDIVDRDVLRASSIGRLHFCLVRPRHSSQSAMTIFFFLMFLKKSLQR